MLKHYLFVFTALICGSVVFGQSAEDKYKQADDFMNDGNYYKAIAIYQDLLTGAPNNANLNFKMGYCYLNTSIDKIKAIPYLEFASRYINENFNPNSIKEEGSPIEVLLFLGKAYHVNYRFDDAERTFLQLKSRLGADDKDLIKEIDHDLSACQVARQLMRSPVEMTVSNMGPNINSPYSEHSPVINGDESMLVFTSKREGNTGNNQMDDGQYFEDIYFSIFDGKNFTKAAKVGTTINTPGHDASVALSFDGTMLFIYRDDNGDGNLYFSNRNGNDWSTPEKFPEPINSKYRETHASMSIDQSVVYFTSNRKGGYGGLDIYRVKKLPNGKWSKAQNLGPQINTAYDEEGPYLHPDGTSLFFASKGHNTMGGYDIFVSYIDDDEKWSVPANLGYPINTPDDNIYYIPSVDGRRAYYASYSNNSLGNYDIFRIDLSESHVRNQTVIRGKAINKDGVVLKQPLITVTDKDDNVVGIYTPEPVNNNFLMILPRGKTFSVLFESNNLPSFTYLIKVPEYSYDETKSVATLMDILTPETKNALAINASKTNNTEAKPETTESKVTTIQSQGLQIERTNNKSVNANSNQAEPNENVIIAEDHSAGEIMNEEPQADSNIEKSSSHEITDRTSADRNTGKSVSKFKSIKNEILMYIGFPVVIIIALSVWLVLRRKRKS